ncbi:hypothetical protein [Criibacterium bergeronii]|nr:hypothetical protein [Criibacterium bergeronii]MBS6062931.1 hypothetical protein [Peptostreptococcaceae bacterium]
MRKKYQITNTELNEIIIQRKTRRQKTSCNTTKSRRNESTRNSKNT